MQVRLGNKQDEAAVRAFVAAINEEQGMGLPDFGGDYSDLRNIEGNYIGHDGCFFVAEEEKRFYAFAAARSVSDEVCELRRLYVDQELRARDMPATIISKVVNFAKQLGYSSLLAVAPAPYLVTDLESAGFVQSKSNGNDYSLDL